MRHSFFFLSLLALLVCSMPSQAATAGKLFPPEATSTKNGCPKDKVLGWTGDRVACLDPSEGIAIGECTGGTVMTGIVNGEPVCVDATPSIICGEGKAIKKIHEGTFECIDVEEGTPGIVALDCGSGRVLHKAIDGKLTCISTSSLTAVCSGDLVLKGIVDGVPDCVAGPSSGSSEQPTVFCPKGTIVESFDSDGNQVCIQPAIVGDLACPSGQSLLRHVNYNSWQGEITDCKLWDAQPKGAILGWYGRSARYIGAVGTATPGCKTVGSLAECLGDGIVVGIDFCYKNGVTKSVAVLCKAYK